MKHVTLSWPALVLLVLFVCCGRVWSVCQNDCSCGGPDDCCYRVTESLPAGQLLGLVTDVNRSATNQLVQEADVTYSSNMADIAINKITNNGEIVTNASLDRETNECFTVVVTVSGSIQSDSFTVAILVLDINDNNPIFTETIQTGSLVHKTNLMETDVVNDRLYCSNSLTASDVDKGENGTVSYSIIQSSNDFTLMTEPEQDRVCLYNNIILDREASPVINVTIQAQDNGIDPLAAVLTVEITLTDINDNSPTFHNPDTNLVIQENATNGSLVVSYNVTDPDSGPNAEILFTAMYDTQQAFPFFINETTGSIYVEITDARDIDVDLPNVRSSYTFLLQAQDKGVPPLTTSIGITITINNINDNPPNLNEFSPIKTRFDEGINHTCCSSNSIIVLRVTDDDNEDTKFTPIITQGAEHAEVVANALVMNLFTIKIVGELDREMEEQFNITVEFSDNGSPNLTSEYNVTIDVNDINDNPPSLTQTNFPTLEQQPQGVILVSLLQYFVDPDSGNNGSYGMFASVSDSIFLISSSGDVTATRALDRETDGPTMELVVRISDSGTPPLSSDVTIILNIEDVNDNRPQFTQSSYEFYIPENTNVSGFGRVQAMDADTGDNAEVRYSTSNTSSFTVDPVTGNLSSIVPYDREAVPTTSFLVTATDMGQPALSQDVNVTVRISDINDNYPMFDQQSYQFSVDSTAGIDSLVGQVSASDRDIGVNAAISYNLSNATYFRINSTGAILIASDLPDNISMLLMAMAYNTNMSLFNTTVPILVNITASTTNSQTLLVYVFSAAIPVAVVGLIVVVMLMLCCCCCYRRRSQRYDFVKTPSPGTVPRKSSLRTATPTSGNDYSDTNGTLPANLSPSATVNFSDDLRVRYYNREEAVINSEVQTKTVTIEEEEGGGGGGGEVMEHAEGEASESQSSQTPTKDETTVEPDVHVSSPQLSEDYSSTSTNSNMDYPSPYYSQPPSNLRKELLQQHNQAYNSAHYPQTEPIAPPYHDTSTHTHYPSEVVPHYPSTIDAPAPLHYSPMEGTGHAHYPTVFNDYLEDRDEVPSYKHGDPAYQDEDQLKSYTYFSRRRSDQTIPVSRYVSQPSSTDSSPILHYTSNPPGVYYHRHNSHGHLSPPARRRYDEQHYPPSSMHINGGTSLRHYSSSSSSSSRHTPLDMSLHYPHGYSRDLPPRSGINGRRSSSEERQLRALPSRLPGYTHPAILEKDLPPPIPYSYNSFASEDASTVASSVLDQYLQYEPPNSLIHDNLSLSVDDVKLSAMDVEKRQRN